MSGFESIILLQTLGGVFFLFFWRGLFSGGRVSDISADISTVPFVFKEYTGELPVKKEPSTGFCGGNPGARSGRCLPPNLH